MPSRHHGRDPFAVVYPGDLEEAARREPICDGRRPGHQLASSKGKSDAYCAQFYGVIEKIRYLATKRFPIC
jgi:hypothetical protein